MRGRSNEKKMHPASNIQRKCSRSCCQTGQVLFGPCLLEGTGVQRGLRGNVLTTIFKSRFVQDDIFFFRIFLAEKFIFKRRIDCVGGKKAKASVTVLSMPPGGRSEMMEETGKSQGRQEAAGVSKITIIIIQICLL